MLNRITDSSGESSRVMRKPVFEYANTKAQISRAVTAQLNSAFVFDTKHNSSTAKIRNFQQCSHRLWLYSPGLCWNWSDTTKTGLSRDAD